MSKFYNVGKYKQKEWADGTFTCTCMHLTMEWARHKDRSKIKPCRHIGEIQDEKKGKYRCQNFKDCKTYTNAKHSKWCQPCSFIWQVRNARYEPEFEIEDGGMCGIVLTRRDIFEAHKNDKKLRKGYVWIHKPNHKYSETKKGWIFEHRAVVEDFIKRALKPEEVIHHINEHKKDNRIENLMIFKNNAEHSKFHNKIRQFGMTNPIKRQIQNRWKNV